MDLQLDGHVAIVTGASTGIGRATAMALAGESARVVGASRRPPPDGDVKGITSVLVDLAGDEGPESVVRQAVELHGRLDILVNNAATGAIGSDPLEQDDRLWIDTLNLNLMAAVRATRAAMPHLLASGGVIVNVTSVNGRVPAAEAPAYSASKAALLNYGKAISSHYANQGVRVVTVSPGLTATPMWLGPDGVAAQLEGLGVGEAAAIAEGAANSTPLKRFLTPEEIANCICFVASPRASGVTGAEFVVDGGVTTTM
jgi:NAD(P)-dependent dehydrogenase (short-subunit alcohol dehydrogenase family)